MIVFDLKCSPRGHVFEAWFGSSGDFEHQQAKGLVQCPLCGAANVEKAVMAPRLSSGPTAVAGEREQGARDPEAVKSMLTAMAAMQKEMLANSDYVGERFTDEARAIFLGETEARSIYGKASPEQTEGLRVEGIAVTRLPFPVLLPGEEN